MITQEPIIEENKVIYLSIGDLWNLAERKEKDGHQCDDSYFLFDSYLFLADFHKLAIACSGMIPVAAFNENVRRIFFRKDWIFGQVAAELIGGQSVSGIVLKDIFDDATAADTTADLGKIKEIIRIMLMQYNADITSAISAYGTLEKKDLSFVFETEFQLKVNANCDKRVDIDFVTNMLYLYKKMNNSIIQHLDQKFVSPDSKSYRLMFGLIAMLRRRAEQKTKEQIHHSLNYLKETKSEPKGI